MTEEEFKKMQVHEIEVQKWLQGERQGSDPGNEFVRKWVAESAADYRAKNFPESISSDHRDEDGQQ